MKLWRFARRLKPAQLWKLCQLCLGNLTKVWPTWKATNRSVALATQFYGKEHQKNTAANAFRHALWTYLIARNCFKRKEQKDKVAEWAKKITDLHEELFPNKELAKAMDLHNNYLGIYYFKKYEWIDDEEIVDRFKSLAQESVLINNLEELALVPPDKMAHMINMEQTI